MRCVPHNMRGVIASVVKELLLDMLMWTCQDWSALGKSFFFKGGCVPRNEVCPIPFGGPQVPRDFFAFLTMRPLFLSDLDADRFMSNIRVEQRGVAPGLSGFAAETTVRVADNDAVAGFFFVVGNRLVRFWGHHRRVSTFFIDLLKPHVFF